MESNQESFKMYSSLVIVTLLVSANAGPISQKPNLRIMGGENATIEAHPWQVSLEYQNEFICGGSIILPNYVLTAGHCVLGIHKDYLTIRAGTAVKEKGGSLHHVQEIFTYDNHNDSATNDLSLIRTQEPFEFDDSRQPVGLFEAGEESSPGISAVVSGWGTLKYGGLSPDQLQAATVPIVQKDLCRVNYPYLSDGEICAGDYELGGKGSCHGDSGGPLTVGGRLAGVVSRGIGCGDPGNPGVYVEVAYFRRWIDQHVHP